MISQQIKSRGYCKFPFDPQTKLNLFIDSTSSPNRMNRNDKNEIM